MSRIKEGKEIRVSFQLFLQHLIILYKVAVIKAIIKINIYRTILKAPLKSCTFIVKSLAMISILIMIGTMKSFERLLEFMTISGAIEKQIAAIKMPTGQSFYR